MYCQNCGAQFESNFCPNCGAPKDSAGMDPAQRTQKSVPDVLAKPRKLTRRWWFWVLLALTVAVLATALTRTGGTGSGTFVPPRKTQKATATEPESAASLEQAQEPFTVSDTVLLDEGGIRVVATGISGEKWFGREIAVLAENDTDRAIAVQVRGVSVNGAMISPIFPCTVEAGKKANDAIPISRTALDKAGIRSIRSIELRIRVFDAENWNTILEGEPVVIPTSAYENGAQEFDESSLIVLEQEGIWLTVRGEGEQDSVWGKGVELLIKNDSGRDVTVQLRGVSINGYMFEPVFSCDITDGKLAYTTVFFSEEALKLNGIEQIERLEFSVQVFDMRTWHSIFQSSPVSVTFPF